MQLYTVQQILSKDFFDLDVGFETRVSSLRVQGPRESIGKKGSRIWSLKILRESGTFPNHSFSILELLEFLYTSFELEQ